MTERWREWLEETHNDNFELLRLFVGSFFDSEMLSVPGEWTKVAAGIFAVLVSIGFVAFTTFYELFNSMEGHLTKARIFAEIRGNEFTFIGLAAAAAALLTALEWQSLFPSRRDCLALASLPVSARQIFFAKLAALALIFAVFVLAMNLPWAVEYSMTTAGHWENNPSTFTVIAANFAATAGVCVFVFFSLLALQGILLNILPARVFGSVSLGVQSAVLILTLGGLPLYNRQPIAPWWPCVWFLHLWESIIKGPAGASRDALLAIAISAALAVLAYLFSYHRYRRLLLEAQSERAPGAAPSAPGAGWGARLLEFWMPDPRQQGAFAFICKTLSRSRTHRLILLAYGGIALGAITKGALDMPRPSLRDEGLYGLIIALAPLALSLLVTAGLRYLFALPESPRANWLFQTTDRDASAAWLAAVERFVVWCAIAPLFAAALPAAVAIFGWIRASAVLLLGFFVALVCFEAMFRQWRKLPFTCSYLPGRQSVWSIVLRYAFAAIFIAPAGQLILSCSAEPMAFLALFTFQAALWHRWRARRRRMWAECALCYEELPDETIMSLGLMPSTEPVVAPGRDAAFVEAAFEPTMLQRRLLPDAWRDEIREERRHPSVVLETMWEDVRFGCRLIRRNPLFAAVVVLTLTVGIGINASVFTIFNAVALRPHVSSHPETFLRITPSARWQGTSRPVSYDEYVSLRDHARSVRALTAFRYIPAVVGDGNLSERAGIAVSCNFFAVDGIDRPLLGRLFVPDDCAVPGRIPVAIVSQSLWRNRLGSDPNAIGRSIRVNNRPALLVGVVADGASRWAESLTLDVWLPYTAIPYFEPSRNPFRRDDLLEFSLAGRLASGFSRPTAEAEFQTLEHARDRDYDGRHTSVAVTDGSWSQQWQLRATTRDVMLMGFFFATFNLVLLIACANVATLLLSRASARRREIAVRLSLGAPRIRIVRMLVTESLVLAAAASALSAVVASRVPLPLFQYLASRSPDFPILADWRTFAYIAGVMLATGILAGLAPALESLRVELTATLKGQAGVFGSGGLRNLLVSAQVALSMVLLVEAALFARSEQQALYADPGYSPRQVVVANVSFPENTQLEAARARLDAIARRVRALPGVQSVAFSDGLPLLRPTTVELSPPSRDDASQPVDIYTASSGFFATLGVPLLRGREFRDGDGAAVVVSESLAKAFWHRADPVGRMLALPEGPVRIIGVARDIASTRTGGSDNPPLYRFRQVDARYNEMSVRFASNAAAGAIAIGNALRDSDPDLFILPVALQDWIDRITQSLWNVASLIVVLGAVATVLACTGIYGAVSFAVSQRARDLGIRVALGATRRHIMREVFVSGGKPVVYGLVAGMWLAAPTAAGLRESVRGSPIRIDSSEPLLYCAAALLLAAAATLAMLGPARRGAGADPLDALRSD